MRRALTSCAVLGALALVPSASAAAPNYILVSGPGLTRPVVLGDWAENGRLLSSVATAPRAKGAAVRGLARRPRFDLAEVWGWSTSLPPPTSPRDAGQHGTFYPAHRSKPAVVVMMVSGSRTPRIAPRAFLTILAQHGVPTRR
jgi:hypothetical protein